MDTTEFDTQIANLEEQIQLLGKPMQKHRECAIFHAKEFCKKRIAEIVKNQVDQKPEQIVKLGASHIAQFKSDLNLLLNRVPQMVDYYVDRGGVFPYMEKMLASSHVEL